VPSRERVAYILNIEHCSSTYREVVYKVIRPGRMLCGSTTMSLATTCCFSAKMWCGIPVMFKSASREI